MFVEDEEESELELQLQAVAAQVEAAAYEIFIHPEKSKIYTGPKDGGF